VGRAMHRISRELAKYAPSEVQIVDGPADIDIVQYWTPDIIPMYHSPKRVILFHCSNGIYGNLVPGIPDDYTRSALFVASWQKLNIDYYAMPLGADPNVFYPESRKKNYKVLTTGYLAEPEYVYEMYHAARANNGTVVHVGNVPIPGKGFLKTEGISDDQLRRLYCESEYVSALRAGEGFEICGVEALMAGTRPIVFSRPDQKWYSKWGIAIHEDTPANVEAQLREVLSKPPNPVTPQEREEIVKTLSWEFICKGFWDELLKRI
jgi:hypothetical protein